MSPGFWNRMSLKSAPTTTHVTRKFILVMKVQIHYDEEDEVMKSTFFRNGARICKWIPSEKVVRFRTNSKCHLAFGIE